MSKLHTTTRKIKGNLCLCQDIGAEDFDRAEFNRYIIKNRLFTTGYQEVEKVVLNTPLSCPLPLWIPSGFLPQVGKKESRESRRESYIEE